VFNLFTEIILIGITWVFTNNAYYYIYDSSTELKSENFPYRFIKAYELNGDNVVKRGIGGIYPFAVLNTLFAAPYDILFFMLFLYIFFVFPFWNRQPVLHPYDVFRLTFPPSVPRFILKPRCSLVGALYDRRRRNKYCDFDFVYFRDSLDEDGGDDFVHRVCLFLQSHFIRDESSLFLFYPSHFLAYHSIGPCFFSYL
jgi:hypothetical protein